MSTDSTIFQQRDFIDGVRKTPGGELGIELCDPSTGAFIAHAALSDVTDVDAAIAAAARVHESGAWRDLSVEERATHLLRIADELESRGADIGVAESTGSGVVIGIASLFGGATAGVFREAVELMRSLDLVEQVGDPDRQVEIHRSPWGPTAVLVPWNAAAAMAAKKCAFALAAGAPVILKPPERSPFGCNIIADAIESAGLPPGVFQLVHGDAGVGQMITTDPRIRAISFTGSVATGRAIASVAAADFKALQLELGGNNPVIVLPDADVPATAASLAAGMVKLNGQWCEGPGKIFVDDSLHDELVTALSDALAEYTLGSHDDPEAQVGPLAYAGHRDQLDAQVAELVAEGGRVTVVGDAPVTTGNFWPPRLITDAPAVCAVEEMFGPVVSIHRMDSVDAAVESANRSPYGLAAYVFGTDIEAAMSVARRLQFGEVKVNGTSLFDLSPRSVQSFWRGSGIGGHGDRDVFLFFCGARIVGVDRTGLPI